MTFFKLFAISGIVTASIACLYVGLGEAGLHLTTKLGLCSLAAVTAAVAAHVSKVKGGII